MDLDLDTETGEMDCVKCGLSEDVETDAWTPLWSEGGAKWDGMWCGRCAR